MSSMQRQLIEIAKTQIFHAWGAWSQAFGHSFEYILMLASARSGSTLLAHILTSNPEIFGMGEAKITLADARDYRQLTGKNLYFHRRNDIPRSGQERYILEKIVHNHLLDPQDSYLLDDPKVRIIFLLRDPGPTITSFMRVVNVDETAALAYFVARMECLAEYAQALDTKKTTLFLTYEELLSCTQPVLNLLQEYLELRKPLSERYQVTSSTGAFVLGDKSENIKSGRIVAPTKSPIDQLAPETLATAQEAYDHCAAILRERSRHIAREQCDDRLPP